MAKDTEPATVSFEKSSPFVSSSVQETVTESLLPLHGLDLKEYLANLEKDLIGQALDDSGGVVARAADRLHVRRTTLVEKMRKYNLQKKQNDEVVDAQPQEETSSEKKPGKKNTAETEAIDNPVGSRISA